MTRSGPAPAPGSAASARSDTDLSETPILVFAAALL